MCAETPVLITVIIPVYNSERYLADALDSVINQSLKEIEVILVDDGSTDQSGAICERYAEKDKRIKVIHQANGGICRARNRGLEAASGCYIAFADNDDLCMEGWLEENFKCIERYQADIVKFGRIAQTVEKDRFILAEDVRNLEFEIYDKNKLRSNYFYLRNKGVFSPVWDGIYKRELIERYHLRFDECLKNGEEDTVFCMRMLPHIDRLVTNTGVYYKHYIRKGFSTSSKFNVGTLNKYVYSSSVENEILCFIQPEYKIGEKEIGYIKNYILPILLQLNHESCCWPISKRIRYLKTLYNYPYFDLELSIEKFIYMFKRDKNKAVIGILFQLRLLSVLLICSKYYYKMIQCKQKCNKAAFKELYEERA